MPDTAFDTLGAARKLKASGIAAEQAGATVEVMSQSASQFVTVEHFDAAIAMLHSRIDALQTGFNARMDTVHTGLNARMDSDVTGLNARIDKLDVRIDSVRAELRAEIWRSILIAVGVLIAANGLMMTILGIVLTNGPTPS